MELADNNTRAFVHPAQIPEREKRMKNLQQRKNYENKIKQLQAQCLPVALLELACADAPIDHSDLDSPRKIRRYVERCIKYYKEKIKELEREEKRAGLLALCLRWFGC